MTNRNALLSDINSALVSRNLKSLAKLGDSSKNEIEILSLLEFFDHSARFFTDVKFAVRFPNGAEGAFTIRFNANGLVSDGAVMVVLINGRFAVVRQWRLPVSRWTYEFPRGFGEKMDQAHINGSLGTLKIADLPLGTLTRELSEEVMANAEVTSVTHLGNVAENSGTSAVVPAYYLVQLRVDESKLSESLKGTEHTMAVKLWEPNELRDEIGGKMCDNHSITAAALALNYISRLPRI